MATKYTINRADWSGRDGTVTCYANGNFVVEGIGRFRISETITLDPDGETKWDIIRWGVYSVDGQWGSEVRLTGGGRLRYDAAKELEASADGIVRDTYGTDSNIPTTHRRAIVAARVLWSTV